MRLLILFIMAGVFFSACKKDKYTTAPQIKYKSVSFNLIDTLNPFAASPQIIFSVTDAEGDLGINDDDTAYVYLKNIKTGESDSVPFPDLKDVSKSDFKADVSASIGRVQSCSTSGFSSIDTFYFEVYIKDFAKNVSNTIITGDPIFRQCQ